MTDTPSVILITGQAGAGHSTALKILEDQGFVSVDNLPLALVDQLVAIEVETEKRQLAVCVDGRTSGFETAPIIGLVNNLRDKFDGGFKHIHISASKSELLRRYQSTRRAHPLAESRMIEAAIALDQDRMEPIAAIADLRIDSTSLSPSGLRTAILSGAGIAQDQRLKLQMMSFAFKEGLPAAADYVFDVRFLSNPHWDPELADMTGLDQPVISYVKADLGFETFFDGLQKMLPAILEKAGQDARPQLTFAFGCTGGRHRSVACANYLGGWLEQQGHDITIQHRELGKFIDKPY